MSWQEMMDLPIPSYFSLIDMVNEIEKDKEKAQKKSMKKGR